MAAVVAADFTRRIERQSIQHELVAGDKAACSGAISGLRRLRIYRPYLDN